MVNAPDLSCIRISLVWEKAEVSDSRNSRQDPGCVFSARHQQDGVDQEVAQGCLPLSQYFKFRDITIFISPYVKYCHLQHD